jgi:hypothetical protein
MMASDYHLAMDEYATTGMILYLFGLFCAYWAQQTRRSPWLCFFAGALFAPITDIILVVKHAADVETQRGRREVRSRNDELSDHARDRS